MDPCMQTKWRREPYPVHPLDTLSQYEVAQDDQDAEILRSGLQTDLRGQQGDLMEVIESLPVHSTIQLDKFPPRCVLGRDVEEQCVWGIDCFTRRLIFDCLELCPELMNEATCEIDSEEDERRRIRDEFIEKRILPAVNALRENGWDLFRAMDCIIRRTTTADSSVIKATAKRFKQLMQCIELQTSSPQPMNDRVKSELVKATDNFRAHPKGQGVICIKKGGLPPGTFVEEYLGELYTPWRWFERQDVIKKRNPDGYLPDFYNIQIERPRDDAKGYGLIFVEAANRGNFASRLCHSCQPNCRMLSLSAEGRITNAIFTLRHVAPGEELTWDYSCVTESEKEYRAAICLCGTVSCRGSFLHFAHSSVFHDIMLKKHNFLNRTALLLRACHEPLTEGDRRRLSAHGIKSYVLTFTTEASKLVPDWLMKWTSLILEFIEQEHNELPRVLMNGSSDYTAQSAEIEANGVKSNRLQNLVITIDKAKHFLRNQAHQDPPLQLLTDKEVLELLWTGENSVVQQAMLEITEYNLKLNKIEKALHKTLKSNSETRVECVQEESNEIAELLKYCKKYQPTNPAEARSGLQHLARMLRKSHSLHLALHDILMLKSRTMYFFKRAQYQGLGSEEVKVSENEIAFSEKLVVDQSSSKKRMRNKIIMTKNYPPEFLWGQLIGWFKQSVYNPASSLSADRRGSVSLPSIENCYSQPVIDGIYESKQRPKMLRSIERKPENPWQLGTIWSFKNQERIYGTPMLDAAIEASKNLPHAGNALRELIEELKDPLSTHELSLSSLSENGSDHRAMDQDSNTNSIEATIDD
eukprot:g5387.t1